MKLKIRNKNYNLTPGISIIKGPLKSTEISDSACVWYNWNEELPHLIDNKLIFQDFFEALIAKVGGFRQKEIAFSNIWSEYWQMYESMENTSSDFEEFNKNIENAKELQDLEKEIVVLSDQKKMLDQLNKGNILTSKQTLLAKIEAEIAHLRPAFNLLEEEFRVADNRMTQFQTSKTNLDQASAELTEIQKDLYKETNLLTKKIDDLENDAQVYLDKLESKEVKANKEDFDRIDGKYQGLKQEMMKVKAVRQQKMQESKIYQTKILEIQRDLKKAKQSIADNQTKYGELKSQYEEKAQHIQTLQKQADEIKKELTSNLLQSPASPQSVGSRNLQYSSISQIDAKIQEVQGRINFLTLSLGKFKQEDLPENLTSLKKNLTALHALFNTVNREQSFAARCADLLTQLKQFVTILNRFLAEMEMNSLVKFVPDPQAGNQLQVKFELISHDKELNLESDMTRNQKAYFYLCFIIAIYCVLKKQVIPINLQMLPESISTKKTISKAVEILQMSFEKFMPDPNVILIIFDPISLLEQNTNITLED